tara:strand:+ start:590 stop:727 length:138 start_codon:yes stop_codon:yes gene_type:complete
METRITLGVALIRVGRFVFLYFDMIDMIDFIDMIDMIYMIDLILI